MHNYTELFDIVNDSDQVIGYATRQQAHKYCLYHRSVHILVFNTKKQLFLQKRALTKDTAAGLWDTSAAGHVDKGEVYDIAAQRELCEELGLCNQPLTPLFKLSASPYTGYEFTWVYKLETDQELVLNTTEIETGAWFTPDEINSWLNLTPETLTPSIRFIWQKYQQCYC